MHAKKTVIVTGASQGIGAAVVQAFLDRGYNVVATSRNVSRAGFAASANLALVDGDIGHAATAPQRRRNGPFSPATGSAAGAGTAATFLAAPSCSAGLPRYWSGRGALSG